MDMSKYINKYEKKTGHSFIDDWDISLYSGIHIFPTGEFVTWGIYPTYIDIGPTSCKWDKAYHYICEIAKKEKITKVRTCTNRNAKAYAKLTGAHVIGHDGNLYFFEKEVE